MEAAMDQIRGFYTKADLQRDLFTDWEILFSLGTGSLQWSLIQIGLDLSIFTTLSSSSNLVTHEELVEKTAAAPNFLTHLLRDMASFGLIEEVSKDVFRASRTTRVFADPNVVGAEPHISGIHLPVAHALPKYLREHKYQDMTDPKDLPFQQALKTDLTPFEWLKRHPEQMKSLGHIMVLDAVKSWVISYPVEREVGSFKAANDSALLVDIGGGFGQHSVAFQKNFPLMTGRIVVQDIPSTLAHAPKIDGIEFHAYDFFTPQPIQGAKFYYLRHILHDWTDEDCIRILSNIIPALGADSRILIDEVVLPNTKVPWQVALMDIAMMACLGGIERCKEDWENLLGRAGLKVVDVHRYDDERFHSIIAAVPK
ncbi:S-adenosyl-L-methionine-dependent methyltransferase [Cucurbitaria berberidis CBS 394.84]|uniref:S-adenosyl-L-methionine-dependent methyltransferase n=1 Tax=Cucurbitaria berberidis CBS 394.84 TaxID=1168544 RepID=A0A9P4GAT4_9PLEO|nr:S-adenosyl-L-methionine-dependent methyltransferase [Cucurbitaria berberidis CBS 394.84]KAF1842114.1 S-adenosyl-L-methionine-dependent methyltransferase [Cucurbitaria berberidis CBS 394.84]